MKKLLYLITFALLTISFNSCIKPGSECRRLYTLEYPVSIYPVDDTISVGDTLWIEINIDNLIEDKETDEIVDISDLDLHFVMFNSRYDFNYDYVSTHEFDFYVLEGIHQISSTRSFLAFDSVDDKRFKMALIPKVSGGQAISIDLPLDYDQDVELDNEECLVSFTNSTRIIINEDGRRNLHLVEGRYLVTSPGDTLWYGTGDELYRITDAYAFYVQE